MNAARKREKNKYRLVRQRSDRERGTGRKRQKRAKR